MKVKMLGTRPRLKVLNNQRAAAPLPLGHQIQSASSPATSVTPSTTETRR